MSDQNFAEKIFYKYKPETGWAHTVDEWIDRGRWQLNFLVHNGLKPEHTFLDVGCGPLRAGIHLIPYLRAWNYKGFDSDKRMVDKAWAIILGEKELNDKSPIIRHSDRWNPEFLPGTTGKFDFGIAFSVLNNLSDAQKISFFKALPSYLNPGKVFFVTHGSWFTKDFLVPETFAFKTIKNTSYAIPSEYGWKKNEGNILPVIKLTRK